MPKLFVGMSEFNAVDWVSRHATINQIQQQGGAMKTGVVIVAGLLTGCNLFAADPFAGTWAWTAGKTPRPSIHYGIKDLGDNTFALTGSTGQTTRIKADGVTIASPFGGTASFKKVSDREWQMIRDDP
jgi:hypothetical protein